MIGREALLVIGVVDVGNVARSAKSAGYLVYTVDLFGDLDVRKYSSRSLSIIDTSRTVHLGERSLAERLFELAEKLLYENRIDSILLASGVEDEDDLLQRLHDLAPIIGNPLEVIRRVRDKIHFFDELKRVNLPSPETRLVHDLKDSISVAKDIGLPLVIKPLRGYGGRGLLKVEGKGDLERFFSKIPEGEWLLQEYVPGVPASISILADGSSSKLLTLNEQLLGKREFGQNEVFAYCGNVVPLNVDDYLTRICGELAAKIVSLFGLKGSNGIDVVYSKQNDEVFKVIEVNPRFQGSMECVERYCNINLVEGHLKACRKELPSALHRPPSTYYTRAIIFAKSDSRVPDLTSYNFVRDMPKPGYEVYKGDPICSIITHSTDRDRCLYNAKYLAETIYRSI